MALRALDRVRNRLSRPTDAARVARINHRWAFCRGTAKPRAWDNVKNVSFSGLADALAAKVAPAGQIAPSFEI
jgi:hypothetical protein